MSMIDGVLAGMKMRKDEGRAEQDEKDAAEDRAFRQQQRARLLSEQQRADAARDGDAAAAAPVTARPELGPDMAGPQTYSVDGGKPIADPGKADAAVADANTPLRTSDRIAQARMGRGDVTGAQTLRTGARQEAVANMQLTAAQEAEAQQKAFREAAAPIAQRGWQAVPEVYSRYNDGHSAQVIEDGKGGATVVNFGPDGKEVGRKSFKSELEFVQGMSARFDPKLWMGAQEKAAETARVQGNSDRDYKLKETESKSRVELRAAQAEAAALRASMAGGGAKSGAAAAGAAPQVSLKDMRDFEEDIYKRLGSEFDPKNATDDAERSKITSARNDAATRASGVFRVNAERGMPVTAEVALNALKLASNPANRKEIPANDGMVYPVVVVNGAPVIVGPGKKPAAPAAPAASPAPAAPQAGAAPPRAPMQPAAAPAAPAAAPAAQGAVPFAEFVTKNITTPAGKQEIARRIQQELPNLQAQISADMKVMGMPMVSGAIKAKLKARVDAASQEAEMMQTFMAGNVGV